MHATIIHVWMVQLVNQVEALTFAFARFIILEQTVRHIQMLAHQVHVWTERHARQQALAALILAHAYPDTLEIIAKYTMHALIILVWTEPLARIQELVIYVYAHNSIQELTARHIQMLALQVHAWTALLVWYRIMEHRIHVAAQLVIQETIVKYTMHALIILV